MDRETLKAKLLEKLNTEGKLSCPIALGLAKELGVAPAELGRIANEENIKIAGCQLGCFK